MEKDLIMSREQTGIEQSSIFLTLQQDSIFQKYKFGLVHSNFPFKLVQGNSNTQCQSDESDSLDSQGCKRVRGPYRKYTIEQKMRAVQRIISGEDVKVISRQFGIPRRNLLRWKKNGCQRKQGGGRPTDAQMEKNIYEKIMNKELQTQKQVRKYAIELSRTTSFKASKGWFVKFCNRFDINLKSSLPQIENEGQIKNESIESMDKQQFQI